MTTDIITSSYDAIDTNNLIPSFFKWMFGGALTLDNGGIFGTALILVVALVSFLVFKGFRYEKAMITSAMITWIISLLALKAGWISNGVFTICCIYVVGGLYYLFKESSGEEA